MGSRLIWPAAAVAYYAVLLAAGGGMFGPVTHGLVFNDMLLHLLHGRVDVDPAAIGDEGYVRDGAVYAYFGILPALFRLVFLPLAGFATTDFTRLGCLAAVALMAGFKAASAVFVADRVGGERAPVLLPPLLAVLLFGGAQIEFLRPSIFQEAVLWADACAAAFVYLALRGWLGEAGFTPRLTAGLALAAGLCLLARVSTALGLYLAFAGLWLALAWRERRLRPAPVAILLGFAAIAAALNLARWGNPLVFVDMSRALILQRFPDRLARLHEYGEFNPIRLLYGIGYYFAPLWALGGGTGRFLWQGFQERVIDAAELPPMSFLVSDTLLLGLAGIGLAGLLRRRDRLLALLPGLLTPIALMLCAISMAFRYRLEFYPFLELCAFAGFARLLAAPGRRTLLWLGAGAGFGVVSAHAAWLLYMLSPFGPAEEALRGASVAAFYRALLP